MELLEKSDITPEKQELPKVIHVTYVVATLDTGGIEKWLLEIVRNEAGRDPQRQQFHIITLFAGDGTLSQEFKDAGVTVSFVPFAWGNLFGSIIRLMRYFRDSRCEVVHCHLDYLAGIVLPAAWIAGCHCRIVHVHNTKFPISSSKSLPKRFLAWGLRRSCSIFSNYTVGCSKAALQAFNTRESDPKSQVMHCSIDFDRVHHVLNQSRARLRDQFEWKVDEKIILHVGRHAVPKNLPFALDVIRQVVETDSKVRFILAGSGEMTEQLKELAQRLGISDRVTFLGNRDDVFDLMFAGDLMFFPSLHEGLPVTLVEAQACGLRILMSDTVTAEVCVVPDLVKVLPLTEKIESWSTTILDMLRLSRANEKACQLAVFNTDFNLDKTLDSLDLLYRYSE